MEANNRPLRILSLDGGGIRGLAALFILQDLMLRIKVQEGLREVPLPCDWFDLIVGTSTGGIIALMLGRLKMSVNGAINAYRLLAKDVFGRETKSWLSKASLSSEPLYSSERLEEAVRKIAGEALLADPADKPKCRVAAVALMPVASDRLPDLLRTYKAKVPPYGCTIVDAARATFAVTTFFRPANVQIRRGLPVTYLDGALEYNNPTSLAVQEAEDIWGSDRRIGCIVSIGTGISSYVRFEGNKLALARKLLDISTGCQAVHMSMNRRFGGAQKRIYFRFDPPNDLTVIGLDEWEKVEYVGELVHAYHLGDQVKIHDCLAALTHPVIQDVVVLRAAVQIANQQEMESTPTAMPPSPAPFFGREDEINEIVQVLVSHPGVGIAILGAGGIGKSAVAAAVLHHHLVEEAFGALRFFVRCDNATGSSGRARASASAIATAADRFISLIGAQLGLDVSRGQTDVLVKFFSRQPAVLVLDSLEALWDGSGSDLDGIFHSLFALQDLRLIVTMRGTITPWGRWQEKRLGTLDIESARKVFIDCSGNAQFRCDPLLDNILSAVDCLPLAIVLLARQAKTESSLQSLWEEWERRRTAIVRDIRYHDGAAGAQLLSLEASIQLSLDRPLMANNPSALTLLSLLSLLPDGASWQDLEALVPSSSLSREHGRPEKVLLQLALAYVESSLAAQRSTRGASHHKVPWQLDDRLHVLAPVREYVQHKFPAGRMDYQRFSNHYLKMAISHATSSLLPRLRADIHNLEAVTIRALGIESEQELAVHSAQVLCDFTEISGIDLPALSRTLVEFVPIQRNAQLRAMAEHILGRLSLLRLDYDKARVSFEAELRLYDDLRDRLGKAKCILSLGEVCLRQSKYEEATARFTEALALYEEADNKRGKADCIRNLGLLALNQSKFEEAAARFSEALLLYENVGDKAGKADCIQNLGLLALDQSKYEEAIPRFTEALALYEEVDNRRGKADCIRNLGLLALNLSSYEEATARFTEALALCEEVDNKRGKADCIRNLGLLAVNMSKYEEAAARFTEALLLYENVGDKAGKADCIQNLGLLALNQSKYEEARERLEEAVRLYEEISQTNGKLRCEYYLSLFAV